MSTVAELHERIDELSEAIEQQKAVLRGLERQKSDAQGELNIILDPMAKLPFEISSEILLESLPSTPGMQASIVLLGVCRRWSDIALATPSLWTTISNNGVRANRYRRLVELWLPRSKHHPLSVSLYRIGLPAFTDLMQSMEDHAQRIQELQLVQPGRGLLELRQDASGMVPLPCLKSLTVEGGEEQLEANLHTWCQILHASRPAT